VSTKTPLTAANIKKLFPWDRMPKNSPQKMRFGLKAGRECYWLDVKDE